MSARASAAAAATLAVLAFGGVALTTSAAGGGGAGPAAPSYRVPLLVHSGSAPTAVIAKAKKPKPVKGLVLGGRTSQHWPVVIRLATNGKKVADALAGIDASTDEYLFTSPDEFVNLPVKNGRFGTTWGPEKVDFGAGYIADCSGGISGKFSRDRSKVSGTWSYRAVLHDPTGAVVVTWDTDVLSWTARQ